MVDSSRAATAEQNAAECVTEVAIAAGVDDGIQRRVGIASPEQRRHYSDRRIVASWTERPAQVPGKKRQPTDDKRADDDPERPCGLVFTSQPTAPRLLTFDLSVTLTLTLTRLHFVALHCDVLHLNAIIVFSLLSN